MDSTFIQAQHSKALPYAQYIANGKPDQQESWKKIYNQAQLTDDQKKLVGSFVRQINVVALSGIWCGDCAQQCPIIQKIAEANPDKINLRWAERDAHPELQDQLTINGGKRVPVIIFAAEDFELAGWFGDRTLGKYRAMAQKHLGASCPLPGAPVSDDEMARTTQEWVDQFERIHLMLRLSGRLRQKHND